MKIAAEIMLPECRNIRQIAPRFLARGYELALLILLAPGQDSHCVSLPRTAGPAPVRVGDLVRPFRMDSYVIQFAEAALELFQRRSIAPPALWIVE